MVPNSWRRFVFRRSPFLRWLANGRLAIGLAWPGANGVLRKCLLDFYCGIGNQSAALDVLAAWR